jgi:hypothetical protein
MRNISVGVCKEKGCYRAYASDGISGNNIAIVKADSRFEALVKLFDYLATEYGLSFYDKE